MSSAGIRCAQRNERFTTLSLELELEGGADSDDQK
jgi:hypothetical protein